MVLVAFGGICARTDAVVQKSYLGWVPILSHKMSWLSYQYNPALPRSKLPN